jgi:hypothetical protein
VRDVARVVDLKSSVGWTIDEVELEQSMVNVMKSVCQVSDEDRALALRWLDEAILSRGGDVAVVWRQRGKDLGEVEDLLFYTRTRMALARGHEWVQSGRCPFWLEASPRFPGVQTHGNRWVLTLEGGGRVTQAYALGQVRYGAGGSGRALIGYGLAERWLLSLGPELGGDASFSNLEIGQLAEFPQLVAFTALPVVLRWQFGISAHLEFEAGPLAYIDEAAADGTTGAVSARYYGGIRTGVALGGTYLRLGRGVLPKFSVAFTAEVIPAVANAPTLTQFGVGVRTGVDVSRWRNF